MKWGLALAQILGLFPVSSLWGSKTFLEMKYQRCSLQMAYSWITFLVRVILKFVLHYALLYAPLDRIPVFDQTVVQQGFGFMFGTGVFYQALAMLQTKEFLIHLQNIEEYDHLYQKKLTKKCDVIRSPFLIYNILFWIANIGTPIAALVYTSMTAVWSNFNNPCYQWLLYIFSNLWSLILVITGMVLVVILYEMASLFVISQLVYMVKGLEHRLEDIVEAIEKHIRESYPEMGRGKLSGKDISSILGQQSSIFHKGDNWKLMKRLPAVDFWTEISQRYLDYTNVFQTFTKFSGIYFVVLYPMQVIGAVLTIYLRTATNVFSGSSDLEVGCTLVMVLGLLRIWAMSNLGYKLEKTYSKMLRKMLCVNECKLDSAEEKAEFERCLKIMESLPMQLNASGYFNVGRSNIPSIITSIVSYIIILFQFRGTGSDQKEFAGLGTSSNTTNTTANDDPLI